MESNGGRRRRLLTAGGILCIVGGAFAVISVILAVDILISNIESLSWDGVLRYCHACAIRSIIVATSVFALGIVTIVGGVSAIRRKSFGLSLAGAICALPSGLMGILNIICVPMGILAIIFVSLGKRGFVGEGLSGI